MIAWGINALNHGSSLAVFDNSGELRQYSVSNTDDNLPSEFIRKALEIGSPSDIFWYERPWVKKARQLYAGQYKTAFDMSVLPSQWVKKKRYTWTKMHYTPHHASHAAAGYYTSPFNHCAVVVLDAIGEFECATIWEGYHCELKKVWSRSYPNSLGLFYSAFTKLIGLEPIKQEHLLQQMAAQGDPKRYYNEVKSYINFTVRLTRNLHRGVLDWPYPIETLQDQCDIAAAVQRVFEDQVSAVMLKARQLIDTDSLVYMGGCAMNSKANEYEVKAWKNVWSLPNPGDPSSSIGAVLYHTKQRLWRDWGPVKHIEIKV
jgi:carbamoyltransferase